LYISDGMKLGFFNGEGVQILRVPAAYTDGDSIVYFRYSDVISTGDIFLNTGYPVIDLEKGGTLQGIIDGLNHVLDIAIAEYRSEGGTMIVPGHGRVTDSSDVAYYRDMLTVIRDRVSDLIKKGMTLEQVKAARPTLDYDGRWGSTTGPWTTEQFVEAVYRSLAGGAR
jgi:glyoxylase-like metal-dependent hydrolase (beta-lactamase superfamily II)